MRNQEVHYFNNLKKSSASQRLRNCVNVSEYTEIRRKMDGEIQKWLFFQLENWANHVFWISWFMSKFLELNKSLK